MTVVHEGNANLLFGFQVLISKEDSNRTKQESSACYWLNQSHYFIRQLSVATYCRFVCCINVAHATDYTLARRWLPVGSDK